MGLRSGEYFGRYCSVARAFSIALRMPGPMWTRQLSIMTMFVAPERGNQALLDIGEENLSGHGTLEHHWGSHFIVAQGGHEGDGLPCSERNGADHPDAPLSPPPEPHHVRADCSLVDKHQPGGIKHALLSHPTSARQRHICSLPFGGLQAFF